MEPPQPPAQPHTTSQQDPRSQPARPTDAASERRLCSATGSDGTSAAAGSGADDECDGGYRRDGCQRGGYRHGGCRRGTERMPPPPMRTPPPPMRIAWPPPIPPPLRKPPPPPPKPRASAEVVVVMRLAAPSAATAAIANIEVRILVNMALSPRALRASAKFDRCRPLVAAYLRVGSTKARKFHGACPLIGCSSG